MYMHLPLSAWFPQLPCSNGIYGMLNSVPCSHQAAEQRGCQQTPLWLCLEISSSVCQQQAQLRLPFIDKGTTYMYISYYAVHYIVQRHYSIWVCVRVYVYYIQYIQYLFQLLDNVNNWLQYSINPIQLDQAIIGDTEEVNSFKSWPVLRVEISKGVVYNTYMSKVIQDMSVSTKLPTVCTQVQWHSVASMS